MMIRFVLAVFLIILAGCAKNTAGKTDKLSADEAKKLLYSEGFEIAQVAGCTAATCTSVEGMLRDTAAGLIELKKLCGQCTKLVLVGGTENGHVDLGLLTHKKGEKADISKEAGNGREFTEALKKEILRQNSHLKKLGENEAHMLVLDKYVYVLNDSPHYWDIGVLTKQ